MKNFATSLPIVCFFVLFIILGFAFRLATAAWWDGHVRARAPSSVAEGPNAPALYFGDSDSYWQLGRALAKGTPYEHDPERHWRIFRMPGYPALLAPLFLLRENPPVFWARLENICVGALTVLLTGLAALAVFRRRSVALCALAWSAMCPELVFQSVCVLSEELFTVLNLLMMIVLAWFARRMDGGNPNLRAGRRALYGMSVLLGVLSALAVYARPDWIYFVPFVAVCFALWRLCSRRRRAPGADLGTGRGAPSGEGTARASRFRAVGRTAVCCLTCFLAFSACMAPWWIRNYQVAGKFVSTTLQMGASLYDGLNPNADGGSGMEFVDRFRELARGGEDGGMAEEGSAAAVGSGAGEGAGVAAGEGGQGGGYYEVRLDRMMKREALDWAKSHPYASLRLAWSKFVRTWGVSPREASFSRPEFRIVLLSSYIPLMCLAAWGVARTFRRGFVYVLPWLPAVYIGLLHLVFVGSIRYRAPALPGLVVMAAYSTVMLWTLVHVWCNGDPRK